MPCLNTKTCHPVTKEDALGDHIETKNPRLAPPWEGLGGRDDAQYGPIIIHLFVTNMKCKWIQNSAALSMCEIDSKAVLFNPMDKPLCNHSVCTVHVYRIKYTYGLCQTNHLRLSDTITTELVPSKSATRPHFQIIL